MKLAEARQLRSDVRKRKQLHQRIALSARTQEGEQPAEDPNALLAEVAELTDRLESLITGIRIFRRPSSAAQLAVPETRPHVVVDQANRLHEGVTDRRADEPEPSALQLLGHRT